MCYSFPLHRGLSRCYIAEANDKSAVSFYPTIPLFGDKGLFLLIGINKEHCFPSSTRFPCPLWIRTIIVNFRDAANLCNMSTDVERYIHQLITIVHLTVVVANTVDDNLPLDNFVRLNIRGPIFQK